MNIKSFLLEELKKIESSHEAPWIEEYIVNQKKLKEIDQLELAKNIVDRRKKNEPLAYILGSWNFRGYEFSVGPGVLIPRPETEELVEFALISFQKEKIWKKANTIRIADFGAGSGCIGITFLLELFSFFRKQNLDIEELSKRFHISLVEKSPEAFEYLENNWKTFQADFLNATVELVAGDWCGQAKENFQLILSNPPYLRPNEVTQVDDSVKNYEPLEALLSKDPEGVNCYKEIIQVASLALNQKGKLFLELGLDQDHFLNNFIQERKLPLKQVNLYKDMSGKNRVLEIQKI